MRAHWLLPALIVPMAASAQSAAGAAESTRTPPSAMRARGEFIPIDRAALMTAPGGATIATLDSAARLQVLGRERGWMRVRLDGWVRDADVRLADSSGYSALSAADLRAAPNVARGKTVRWRVQVIALQTADPLRRDLAPNEPYLLARGPGREDALLYLAIPPSLLDAARALDPLSMVTVVARVRVGRSEPSGVPILDVERIVQR